MERVMRAVGVVPYAASQCSQLLVLYKHGFFAYVFSRTVNMAQHSHGDFPTVRHLSGSCEWWKDHKLYRSGGKPHSVWLKDGHCFWSGGNAEKHPPYSDGLLKWFS